ncbi:MAG: methionine biosynthesis protein MetW [Candidatus Saganbacteria bacterium]|nr:methionine biosynthesis protein MetW [Candidatus Saganbacteria bacterium]
MIDWGKLRPDHRQILEIVDARTSILDLGCGPGELMQLLEQEKKARIVGIEIDEKAVRECVEKGLSVFHGDIDSGLSEYRDKSFDYVILNQSLQQVAHVEKVLDDAIRVGNKVIVGIPNFAYYKSRLQLVLRGRMPVTASLPYKWFETPNVRFLTIYDFIDFCKKNRINIERKIFIGEKKKAFIFPNMFATTGLFVLSRKNGGEK